MPQKVPFEQFYEATGRATATWQLFEDALCDVFSRTVVCAIAGTIGNPNALKLVAGIFYASTNFRGNIQMISNVIDQTVNDPNIRSEWNAIKNRATTLYKRRNTLAHGHVWGNENGASSIMASIFNLNARKSLTYMQVCASERSFRRLADRTSKLAITINRHLVRPRAAKPE